MSVSKKTLERPVLTLMVFALLGVMGVFTLSNLSVSLYPDIDSPYISVSTTYKNAGPESVEKSVTKLLEGALVSVSGLKTLTSTSSEGSSSISLEFNYGTDLDNAVNDIRDKLDRVKRSLPDDATTPSIFKMDADSRPIMRLAVRGNRTNDDLKQIAEDNVTDILEQADGIAEASVSGGRTKIVRVELEQNRLAAYGLTMSAVSQALSRQNLELGGGKLTEGKKDYVVRTTGEFASIDEINDTVITSAAGYNVRLRDIGSAAFGFEDVSSIVYINGEPGVYISLTKQSGSNTMTVANAAYQKIAQAQASLPNDVTLEIISDDTDSIRETLATLVSSAWQGLLLAVIILFVFLQNFKSTLIISISIPLSLVITILCMYFAGITLNMMTLTGLILGVGMIVDASIVMIENIYTYRSRGARAKIAAALGSQEMVMSVVSGNLTTICVFIPFIFFVRQLEMMGQMFKAIIFTIVIALLSSLFAAVFLVPVLAGKFLPLSNRKEKPVKSKILRAMYGAFEKPIARLTALYRSALGAAMRHRAITVIVALTVLAIAIALIPTMRFNMMGNNGGDDSVTLNITMPTGTTLDETAEVVKRFEGFVRDEVKGYKNCITTIGSRGRRGTSYNGNININLPKTDEQIDNSEAIQAKLRAHFADFADARFTFGKGRGQQMSGDDLKIVLRSDDLGMALDVADKIKDVMDSIDDIGEVSIDTEKGLPQVEIVIDRRRAYSFGIDVNTVANEINYAMNGAAATVYRENGKEYDIRIMYRPEDREKVSDLESIYVRGSSGMVSVANFASLKKGLGPVTIKRENQTRRVQLTAGILGQRNASDVERDIKDGISNSFVIPEGVTVAYEGSLQKMQKQYSIYAMIAAMALLLVFGVMAATYESFKAPLINLMTIPFLIIGVVFIYKLTGQALSVTSMVGVIMLMGIVVNNGIILVDYTNLLVERGTPLMEACLEAGASRLRPVLMTTLTTILGTLPLCFNSEGPSSMVQPIGMAIVGGLASSAFVTLFFIPVMYSIVMRGGKSAREHELPKEIEEPPREAATTAGGLSRVDIIANQSVRDDITETLEQAVPGIRYTIIPTVNGRGEDDRKLGTTTWPETNFMLTAYVPREQAATALGVVAFLKKKFPKEGIKAFAL